MSYCKRGGCAWKAFKMGIAQVELDELEGVNKGGVNELL